MILLYGIPNCDTMKKARSWLEGQGRAYQFHDYKKLGISEPVLREWMVQVGWEVLVNRQGTTWKKLNAAAQASVCDADSAIPLLIASPSLIKRPVLQADGRLIVGFKPEQYAAFFS